MDYQLIFCALSFHAQLTSFCLRMCPILCKLGGKDLNTQIAKGGFNRSEQICGCRGFGERRDSCCIRSDCQTLLVLELPSCAAESESAMQHSGSQTAQPSFSEKLPAQACVELSCPSAHITKRPFN